MNIPISVYGKGAAICPPETIVISVDYEFIIKQLSERCPSLTIEVINCLRQMGEAKRTA